MKRFLLSVAAALVAPAAFCTDEITCERYPDADTVLVNELERVECFPDGTSETWDESWTKILTEKGRRSESSTSLDYSKRYGLGEIVYVGAIGTNGIERQIDVSKTTKEQTDNSSMSSNIYDPLDRRIVCRIPGLQVGETVHVKTHRKMLKPRAEGKWADLSVMEWSCPIVRSTYEVKAPKSLPIRRKVIRHPLGNVVSSSRTLDDGSVVHTFTVTNSPQAFPEPDMPPLYTQVQHVRVSTAESWPEISRWYWNLCAPHLAKTNAAMVAKVKELAASVNSQTSQLPNSSTSQLPNFSTPLLRALFKFVSQEVRYMGLTMEDTSPGYAPHDVNITFDNRYGVCRDKAVLLVAMLRLAGFEAYPVLIHVGAKLDPEVPQPYFNHAVVAVDVGELNSWSVEKLKSGEADTVTAGSRDSSTSQLFNSSTYLLMDPTNENTKDLFPSYLCNCSYLVARPEGETLQTSPVVSSAGNALDVTTKGTLSRDGSLVLENDLRFGGVNDTAYRGYLVSQKPEDRAKFFESWVRHLSPGAELVRCEIEPKDLRDTESPLRVRLATRLPEMVLDGETRDELNVPFVSKGFGMVNFLLSGNTSLEKRRFTLKLDTTARVRETVEIDLGGAVGAVRELPTAVRDGRDGFRHELTYAVTNGTLSAGRLIEVSSVEFAPDSYLALREEIKRMEAAARKRPVFAKNDLGEAHVRYLLDSSETTVLSDSEWVTTNTVVKEVLTYDGKKKSAELKFSFNPTWKNVELLSASVSNRNGKVYSVTPKEMNVMDCAWAAAAPRYPAGKTLVVNLPSVEIGSVISYRTVVTVTNAPAPFYGAYRFDTREPVDRRVVRVNGWTRDERNLKVVPNEPDQPYGSLWRDTVIISSNRFHRIDLAVEELDPAVLGPQPSALNPQPSTLNSIRNWMAKHVKVVGPAFYDVPLACQLTPPETVVKERYATRLDYIRTLCALLRGAGYEADVVLASAGGDDPECIKRRDMFEKPDVRRFDSALCRVRMKEGGWFFGLFGDEKTYFIGTENEYTPLGATDHLGDDFFDPETCAFGVVGVPDAELNPGEVETAEISVRENGAVDMTVEKLTKGPSVGSFRKRYAEMLPEDRSRHHQALLGAIAQAASATGELETDVEGYPARRTFSCYIPDYAALGKDTLTLQLPGLDCPLPGLTGRVRRSPLAIDAEENKEQVLTVAFPEGYTEIEHLPEPFAFTDPSDPNRLWFAATVGQSVSNGVLTVTVSRKTLKRPYSWYGKGFCELIRDWRRQGTSCANRTIVVRRR